MSNRNNAHVVVVSDIATETENINDVVNDKLYSNSSIYTGSGVTVVIAFAIVSLNQHFSFQFSQTLF